jgi:hypothetical protein
VFNALVNRVAILERLVIGSPLLFAGLGGLAWFFATGRPLTRLTLAGNRLTIAVSRTLRPEYHEWGLNQIVLIRVYRGLSVVTADHTARVLSEREPGEVNWIATLLQQAVVANQGVVPALVPKRPGELAVSFSRRPQLLPLAGFLRVRPGELAVRYGFLETPLYEFFAAPAWTAAVLWRSCVGRAYPLSAEDITCRIDDEGTACLQIGRSAWPQISLSVWCEDREALESALAQFWGAGE